MKRPALFLDRDGVVNIDHGHVYRQQDIEFIEGIFDLVRAANSSGHLVIIVTNQAGIGRGLYSETDFLLLMDWMRSQFIKHQARIDAVYHSPYHPVHGLGPYRKMSPCRKPGPGMLLKADSDLGVDFSRSLIIGDRATDLEAGRAAGVGRLLHYSPKGMVACKLGKSIANLRQAIPYLNLNSSG